MEPLFLHHMRHVLGMKYVQKVMLHENLTNLRRVVALVIQRGTSAAEVWHALYGAASYNIEIGKYIVAVNDDIDLDSPDSLLWAMSYRANPLTDLQVLPNRIEGHGPHNPASNGRDGCLLIDATLKGDFPPLSLPKREYMERAREIWNELGLPPLTPETPWYGYSLGDWPDEYAQAAERAIAGDAFENGRLVAQTRTRDASMNDDARRFDVSSGRSS